MRLSTKGRYAMRAMIELALREGDRPVMVREIAAAQEISEDYLEQVLIVLRRAGKVRSVRGAGGGYLLNVPAEKLTALEIVETVEGSLLPVDCIEIPKGCSRSEKCAARDLWCEASEAMRSILQKTTLAQLAKRQQAKNTSPIFQI
jgi:Rrf2 family protein